MNERDGVILRDVEVVDKTDLRVICRVGDRTIKIPPLRILEGTTIRSPGDRGVLILPRDVAEELGLI